MFRTVKKGDHITVIPTLFTVLDWMLGGVNHPCTLMLKSIVIEWRI